MTAQFNPGICHIDGTRLVDKMIIPIIMMKDKTKDSQNRFAIFGISSQKFERSTSFLVAPHVMLYEKR